MNLTEAVPAKPGTNQKLLDEDARWQLVQRIIASEGFQRASQLRSILVYATRLAILRPSEVLSEYEVACKILGRRPDFNPANDNIVRAQFSHLRNKLKHYFDTEGREEPLILTFPRGSYLPAFAPGTDRHRPHAGTDSQAEESEQGAAGSDAPARRQEQLSTLLNWKLASALLVNVIFIAGTVWYVRSQTLKAGHVEPQPAANAFVDFLGRSIGEVTIVVPDTSLAIIQQVAQSNLSLSDYVSKDFPQTEADKVSDPAEKQTILSLGSFRTTSVNEAMIAVDFLDTLKRAGVYGTIRYARDLHVQDLNQDNTILIGGPNSDPWTSLFADRINFRHVDDLKHDLHCFENVHPAHGEQSRYINTYDNQSLGYVDVALTENPSQTGYALLINGADLQTNEAAARFLLHGRLPQEITSVLSRKDVRYFELFLRGKHLAGEAVDSFELVAFRLK